MVIKEIKEGRIMRATRKNGRHNRIFFPGIIGLILTLCLAVSLMSCAIGEGADAGTGSSGGSSASVDGTLTAHFIDVGQGDCTLLVSGGEAMLIDTGNRDDSQLIIGYLDDLGITELKYIVFTHPHEDHIGSGEAIISQVSVDRIYKMGEYDSSIASPLESAIKNQGIETVTPSSGDTAKLGSCIINFIGPLNNYSDINDDSICLKITFGNTSMLFTGDASSTAERDMIDEGLDLETDILQVGHHGSNQSSSYYFLRESNPKYAVISCGVNNMYGHPHDEVLSRLNDLGAEVFRTDEQGTIIATSDGTDITFNCEGKEATRSHVDSQEDASYIGNVNSKVYHVPTCSSLPYENNRVYFTSVDAAEKAGYNPCGRCKPT